MNPVFSPSNFSSLTIVAQQATFFNFIVTDSDIMKYLEPPALQMNQVIKNVS